MTAQTKDALARLLELEKQSTAIKQEAHLLREHIQDQSFEQTTAPDGTPQVTIVNDEDWDFRAGRNANGTLGLLVRSLDLLKREGEKIKIGPFANAVEARNAQSQLSKAITDLLWPRRTDANGKTYAPYESHVRKVEGKYHLFVKRTYAPKDTPHA